MNKLERNDKCRCLSGIKYKKCCLKIDESAELNQYRNICLIVGNGITYDYISENKLDSINPAKPLSGFNCPEISYKEFIDKVPDIKVMMQNGPYNNDFDEINKYSRRYSADTNKDCQLRRFLAISYSLLQLKMEEYQSLWSWKWAKWFYANSSKISGAISFNYDVILETTFKTVGLKYYRTGTTNELTGIPIVKPHGSIDFEISDGFIGGVNNPEGIWNIHTRLNSCNNLVKVIQKDKWLYPRLEPDIIPPWEENYQLNLGWVDTGYKILSKKFNEIEAFLIVGFSYGFADQKEFNLIINMIPKGKIIDFLIVNPTEQIELQEYLLSKGHRVKQIKVGLPW